MVHCRLTTQDFELRPDLSMGQHHEGHDLSQIVLHWFAGAVRHPKAEILNLKFTILYVPIMIEWKIVRSRTNM